MEAFQASHPSRQPDTPADLQVWEQHKPATNASDAPAQQAHFIVQDDKITLWSLRQGGEIFCFIIYHG